MIFSVRRLSEFSDYHGAFAQSDPWRQEQVLQLKSPFAQKQCLLGDALARELIGKDVHFLRDVNLKPYVQDGSMHFNISHSGEFVLCAVDERPIGADIEELRAVKPKLIERVCTDAEIEWIAGRRERFLQVWTAKEAYLKYLGVGLRKNPKEVSVICENRICIEGLQVFSDLTDRYTMSIVYEKRHR